MVRSTSFIAALLWLPSISKGFATVHQFARIAAAVCSRRHRCMAFALSASTPDKDKNPEDKDDTASVAQDWDVDLYQNHHSFVWEYGTSLVDLLDPKPEDFILDVGCGSGELTGMIAEKGADVVGIDADPEMVENAILNFPHIDFPCVDASKLLGNQEMASMVVIRRFDAIFSNAALHWVTDAEDAVIGMASLLKDGGRFVVEFGGKGNVEQIVQAALEVVREKKSSASNNKNNNDDNVANPWYFPTIAEYSSLLEKHGIEVTSAVLYDRPTLLQDGENGMKHWLEMFGNVLFKDIPESEKDTTIDAVVERLRRTTNLYDSKERQWTADYRRIRIVGKKITHNGSSSKNDTSTPDWS